MKKGHGYVLKTNEYEYFLDNRGYLFIKDKKNGKFFLGHLGSEELEKKISEFDMVKWNLKDLIGFLYIMIAFFLFAVILFNLKDIFIPIHINFEMYLLSILFIIFNVLLHEFSHASMMKLFEKQVGKLKFKFIWIFPMILVDTSDIYTLPKFRKILVCLAGLATNCYLCFILFLFNRISFLIIPMISVIICNAVPIPKLRNDGYNTLIFVLNHPRIKGQKKVSDIVGSLILLCVTCFFLYSFIKR